MPVTDHISAYLKLNLKKIFQNYLILWFLKIIYICNFFNKNIPDDSPYKNLNSMLIYDTLRLKPKVKDNNPKTIVS